jgi:hypothetical protein
MSQESPTKSQIEKLPMWAQKHMDTLRGQRDAAVKTLLEFKDTQTESGVFIQAHPCIGKSVDSSEAGTGPTFVKSFIQAKRVYFQLPRADLELEVYVNQDKQRVELRCPRGYPLIEPRGASEFYLVAREGYALQPSAYDVLRAVQDADKLEFDDFAKKYGFSKQAIPDMIEKVVPKGSRLNDGD